MRTNKFICFAFLLCGLLIGTARGETFQLTDGRTVVGEVVTASANEEGVQVRLDDGRYERIPWSGLNQDDLKKLAEDRRVAQFAEPFIEVPLEERVNRANLNIKPVPRLDQPLGQSLLGAMFSSGLGVFVLLVVYAANIFAAYEIAIFRAQPVALVCGVAAVAPLFGPILFVCLPTRMRKSDEDDLEPASAASPTLPSPAAAAAAAAAAQQAQGLPAAGADRPAGAAASGSLRLGQAESTQASPNIPEAQTFQRGAFTFNRRFFETKFAGFFGLNRRDAEKDMVLVVKGSRGTTVGDRITRITGTDIHLQTQAGQEVMIPFSEVQQVQLKHKDA